VSVSIIQCTCICVFVSFLQRYNTDSLLLADRHTVAAHKANNDISTAYIIVNNEICPAAAADHGADTVGKEANDAAQISQIFDSPAHIHSVVTNTFVYFTKYRGQNQYLNSK